MPSADGRPISLCVCAHAHREEMTHIKQTELRLEMLPSWGGGGGWLGGHWSFKKITLRAQESSSAFKGLLDH